MRMAKLAKYLPELGWDVSVVCSAESAVDVLDPALRRELPGSVVVHTIRGPMGSVIGPAKRLVGAGSEQRSGPLRRAKRVLRAAVKSVLIPDRWLGWARRVSEMTVEELGDPDVILSSGPPHSAHLAGRWLSERLGKPLVMDLRDDWAGGGFRRARAPWRAPIEGHLEQRCIRHASVVVHVSEASRMALDRRYPSLVGRFHAITNGYDPDDVGAMPARRAVPPGDVTRFLYAGSLRGNQVVGNFLEVFGTVARAQQAGLSLELLGPVDPPFRELALRVIDAGSTRLSSSVPHSEALGAMAKSDVLVVFTGGGGAGADTMTGKLFEYMALRRPILLIGPPGPAADLVAGSGAGVVADPWDRDELQAAMSKVAGLAADPSFAGAPDETIVQFDRRSLALQWAKLLGEAIAESRD